MFFISFSVHLSPLSLNFYLSRIHSHLVPSLFYLTDNQLNSLKCEYQRRCRGVREDTERRRERRRGANPLRDTNAAEEEVSVGDVTANDSASKNMATSVVL